MDQWGWGQEEAIFNIGTYRIVDPGAVDLDPVGVGLGPDPIFE